MVAAVCPTGNHSKCDFFQNYRELHYLRDCVEVKDQGVLQRSPPVLLDSITCASVT